MTTVLSSSSSSIPDERFIAAAALDAAEEQLQTITASFAGTFVAVERRSNEYHNYVQQLLQQIDTAMSDTTNCVHVLEAQQDDDDDGATTTSTTSTKQRDERAATTTTSATTASATTSLSVLAERHRVRRRTLLQHSSLLELLELPNIMDACVRSNLYEEAIQIAAFANTLSRRHSSNENTTTSSASSSTDAGESTDMAAANNSKQPSSSANTVVQQVIRQIRSRQADLRRHLIGRLRVAVTMPECLEVVTAVRRLNAIDLESNSTTTTMTGMVAAAGKTSRNTLEQQHTAMEYQLQIAFLEARDVWVDMKTTMGSSSSASQEETLLDAIERYRTRMFEVATQFNAIFRAQQVAASSTQLLALWTSRRVQSFLTLLRTELHHHQRTIVVQAQPNRYDAAAIRDAVEAAVFFSTSLGRLGADFTGQLPSIFEPVLLLTITKYWTDGLLQFRETLTVCREAGVATPLSTETTLDDGTTEESSEGSSTTLDGPQPAPKKLLSLPPLARLVNAVLSGLNELRRCLLPGIFPALRRCLESDILQAVASELLLNERAVLTPGFRGDAAALRAVAADMQSTFRQIVEPYLRGSLEAAIGNTAAAIQHHQVLRDNLVAATVTEPTKQEESSEKGTEDIVEATTMTQEEVVVNPDGQSEPTPDGASPAQGDGAESELTDHLEAAADSEDPDPDQE